MSQNVPTSFFSDEKFEFDSPDKSPDKAANKLCGDFVSESPHGDVWFFLFTGDLAGLVFFFQSNDQAGQYADCK